MDEELKPCPFCESQPVTKTDATRQIYSVECPNCVSVGFHNHYRFGCMADEQWNTRPETVPLSVVEEVLFNELEIYMKKSDIDRILKNIANKKEGL